MSTAADQDAADSSTDDGRPPGTDPTRWKGVAKAVAAKVKENHVPLNASGVAFWGFLSIIPGLVALVSIYGLVSDPDDIEARIDDVAAALPDEVRQLVVQQLESITATGGGALTIGLIVSVAAALWTASSGVNYLIEALNVAFDRVESRGFLIRRGLSLLFTVGALIVVGLVVAVITAAPAVLSGLGLAGPLRWVVSLALWPVIGLIMMVALAVLYRHGPDRDPDTPWTWTSTGSVLAVVGWVIASVAFQVYVGNFGSYNETYGSLGAIVVMLLWLLISALMVLVGAEVNAEIERRTEPAIDE